MRNLRKKILFSCSIILLIITILGYISEKILIIELMSHFRFQYCFLAVVLLFLSVIVKHKKSLILVSLIIILNIIDIFPLYFKSSNLSNNDYRFKLILLNVEASQQNYEKVNRFLTQNEADIVILQEFDSKCKKDIQSVIKKYKYKILNPQEDNFGIALLSNIELSNYEVIKTGEILSPTILASLRIKDVDFDLIATHPIPPFNSKYLYWRNNQMEEVIDLGKSCSDNLIIAGDFNMTSFSPMFKKVISSLDLKDSRKGFGLQETWNARSGLIKITLDHCLYSKNFYTINHEVGEYVGSDHLPIILNLGINNKGMD